MTPETLDALRQAWEGELFGEALMRELTWRLADAAAHSGELDAIARLERRMARALARLPGVAQEGSAARAAIQARAIASRLTTWEAFLEASRPSLSLALERFRAIALPEAGQERAVLDLLVRHEIALIQFLEQSAAGCPPERNPALEQIECDLMRFLDTG